MRPRIQVLARAAALAEQTAARSTDTRHHLEAEALKRELAAELGRGAHTLTDVTHPLLRRHSVLPVAWLCNPLNGALAMKRNFTKS